MASGARAASVRIASRMPLSFSNAVEEIVAVDQPLRGGADVLAAAAGMQPRNIGAAGGHQVLLDHQIIARARRAGLVAGGIDLDDGVMDLAPERLWHDAALDDHHRGSLVDLGHPEELVAGGGVEGAICPIVRIMPVVNTIARGHAILPVLAVFGRRATIARRLASVSAGQP